MQSISELLEFAGYVAGDGEYISTNHLPRIVIPASEWVGLTVEEFKKKAHAKRWIAKSGNAPASDVIIPERRSTYVSEEEAERYASQRERDVSYEKLCEKLHIQRELFAQLFKDKRLILRRSKMSTLEKSEYVRQYGSRAFLNLPA